MNILPKVRPTMLVFNALKIRQRDTDLYITAIRGRDLLKLMEPVSGQSSLRADIWSKDDNPDGYQRNPEKKRIRSISDFLLGKSGVKPLLPQSIILNLRKRAIKFVSHSSEASGGPTYGTLKIEDEAGALWEVDGQHRARGLCEAVKRNPKLNEYYLPVTLVASLTRPDEALGFVAINTTQVRVKPDLVLRILWRQYREHAKAAERFLGTDKWKIDAVDIVDAMNKDPESPFHANIALPGTSVAGKLTSERTFVDSLEPLSIDAELLTTRYVGEFWKAIAVTYPKLARESNLLESVIFKGVGLYTLHKIAPLVAYYSEAVEGGYRRKAIERTVRTALRQFKQSFWMKDGKARDFNNRLGYNRLADRAIFNLLSSKPPKISKKLRTNTRLESEVVKLTTLRNYRAFNETTIRKIDYEWAGTYALINLRNASVYVGMSGEALTTRLWQHLSEDYDIFNWRKVATPGMASSIERSTWHAFKEAGWKMVNRRHPEAKEYITCPVCHRKT